MEYRTLGRTGITVSTYCLGTMMMGIGGNTDHDECVAMIDKSLDAGVNFVDTADVYSNGESEEILAKALKGKRDDIVLATKFHGPRGQDPNRRGGSRRWIMKAIEESLRRLDTDWIDLYQMHRPPVGSDIEEALGALTDLVHQGKVRSIGCSTFEAEQIVEAQWASEKWGYARFRTEQPSYSIFVREIERSVLPTCARYGMGVLVYSPLNGGWLTGKYRTGQPMPEGSRGSRRWGPITGRWDFERDAVKRKLELVDTLEGVAREAGLSLTHLAMAWSLEHPVVSSSIIGPRTMEQLDDVLAGADVRLDTATLDTIDELCPPGLKVDPTDINKNTDALSVENRRRSR